MGFKVQVRVIQARNLAAKDSNGFSDPYVRLQLGKQKAKSVTIYKNLNPVWNDEFIMKVDDADNDVLLIDLWDEDFMQTDDFLGHISVPIIDVMKTDGNSLPPTWYPLQKRSPKSKMRVSGDVQIGVSIWGRDESAIPRATSVSPSSSIESAYSQPLPPGLDSSSRTSSSFSDQLSSADESDRDSSPSARSSGKSSSLRHRLSMALSPSTGGAQLPRGAPLGVKPGALRLGPLQLPSKGAFGSVGGRQSTGAAAPGEARLPDGAELMDGSGSGGEGAGSQDSVVVAPSWFAEDLKEVLSKGDLPLPYAGGTVVDHAFGVSARELNAILFKPDSEFCQEFATARKITAVEPGPWTRRSGDPQEPIRRVVTYATAPNALVKSVKATEAYAYRRADAGGYAVESSVATPDVPYGSTFLTEMLFCIAPIDEKSCHLVVSWRANFLQSTMMKGMIENGMRTGIKDTYGIFTRLIVKYAPLAKSVVSAPAQPVVPQANWEYGLEYLGRTAVVVTLLALVLLPVHFARSPRRTAGRQGLEFWGLDLPDTFLELLSSAVLVLLGERAVERVASFVAYRLLRKSDHGKRANGEGWLLTTTLLAGENLPPTGLTGYPDPYVTITCNGKSRSSSVKLQTLNPQWNEILEFDAFDDPPSTMDVELFDYDGPFASAGLLGRAEINFLKRTTAELADLWVPLEGRRAKAQNARLHLRIFLTNTADGTMPKIMQNLEKEVGAKMVQKSAERNESFQKLFSLPNHEFLINDFACAVKKKIPLQGHLFVSSRLLGFYSNLFGMKTKFTLLWEDIEEMKENAPSIHALNRLINPSITVYLRRGKGNEERIGAYGVDSLGRLKFRFLSFVRPSIAFRTITVLWKNRALPPEQQLEKVQEAHQAASKHPAAEDTQGEQAPFVGGEEPSMEEVARLDVPVTVEQFLAVVDHPNRLDRITVQLGMLNFSATEWEPIEAQNGLSKQRRSLKYCLSRQACPFGSAVSVVQQKWKAADNSVATIEEVVTLHDVPFGDDFVIVTKREIRNKSPPPKAMSGIVAWLGIAWHKDSGCKDKTTHNIKEAYKKSLTRTQNIIISEVIAATQGGASQSHSSTGSESP